MQLVLELEKKSPQDWPSLLKPEVDPHASPPPPLSPVPKTVKIVDPGLDAYLKRDESQYFVWDKSPRVPAVPGDG